MPWPLGVYTNRFNHRHKEFGHLFGGRYKALLIDGSGNGYLKEALRRGEDEPCSRRKGDAGKVRIAAGLRRETTMTLGRIAEHLPWARLVV
jgi:hypothetical protein